jgi:pimeloyl-ACP methyl ester carboxylesterase
MSPYYQEAGDPNKKTIVFVHGAGGSSATWFMQLKNLSRQLHIVAIDLNGHGRTLNRPGSGVEISYLEDIEQTLSKYDAPILGGHSMGGALAQLYALKRPEQLSGLVLIGTGARLKVNAIIFDLLEKDFEGYVDALGAYMFFESASEEMIETSKEEVRKCPSEIIRRDFDFCNEFDIMNEISSIRVPTLIIVGKQDAMTPVKYADYLHQKIEGSVLQVIENAGHMVMLEKAPEVNSTIANWVSSLD